MKKKLLILFAFLAMAIGARAQDVYKYKTDVVYSEDSVYSNTLHSVYTAVFTLYKNASDNSPSHAALIRNVSYGECAIVDNVIYEGEVYPITMFDERSLFVSWEKESLLESYKQLRILSIPNLSLISGGDIMSTVDYGPLFPNLIKLEMPKLAIVECAECFLCGNISPKLTELSFPSLKRFQYHAVTAFLFEGECNIKRIDIPINTSFEAKHVGLYFSFPNQFPIINLLDAPTVSSTFSFQDNGKVVRFIIPPGKLIRFFEESYFESHKRNKIELYSPVSIKKNK